MASSARPAPWTQGFEGEAVALVRRVAATGDRDGWRALMVMIAPHLERWASRHRLLVRCRLANADDARAVMVAAFERLAANAYENLRRFAAKEPVVEVGGDDLVAQVVRLVKLGDGDGDAPHEDEACATADTPLRAWLLRLVDFAARDHVRRRLGWSHDGASKRAMHSDAAPLDDQVEQGARPPMTDRLTVAQLVADVLAHVATFPVDMRTALTMWLDDEAPAAIAAALALADAAQAAALVRAGQARLRDHFRGRSPVLFP